jgi:hypothetical protein
MAAGKPMTSKPTKRERSEQIAKKRTEKAIKAIRRIGDLGDRARFELTQSDLDKIGAALSEEVKNLRSHLSVDPLDVSFDL